MYRGSFDTSARTELFVVLLIAVAGIAAAGAVALTPWDRAPTGWHHPTGAVIRVDSPGDDRLTRHQRPDTTR